MKKEAYYIIGDDDTTTDSKKGQQKEALFMMMIPPLSRGNAWFVSYFHQYSIVEDEMKSPLSLVMIMDNNRVITSCPTMNSSRLTKSSLETRSCATASSDGQWNEERTSPVRMLLFHWEKLRLDHPFVHFNVQRK